MSSKLAKLNEVLKVALEFHEYKKLHPRTKKTPNDPLFSKGKSTAPAQPSSTKTKAPAKSDAPAKSQPAWKKKNPNLSAHQVKGIEKAIEILKRDNNSDLNPSLKKFEQGKITKDQLADVCENWNWHAVAALLRADKHTDIDVVTHADSRHNGIDLGGKDEKEQYAGEREHLFDARYEAMDSKFSGDSDRDKQRHINALTYLNHHGLHDTETAKRLKKLVEKNKPAYKKQFKEMGKDHEENLEREKENLLNFQPDPKHPQWSKKDQLHYVLDLEKKRDKHREIGKVLGLA